MRTVYFIEREKQETINLLFWIVLVLGFPFDLLDHRLDPSCWARSKSQKKRKNKKGGQDQRLQAPCKSLPELCLLVLVKIVGDFKHVA